MISQNPGQRRSMIHHLRSFLTVLIVQGVTLAGDALPSPPPNIVLIYVDNLGYGDLGCYGNSEIQSPRLDKLADQSVRCTDFYVVSPGCTPSRGALLTGRYPRRNGLTFQLATTENWTGQGLPHRERILPEYLADAGYTTACFGKWNIGFAPGSRPTERGFDEFLGCRSGNIHYFKHTYHGDYDIFKGLHRHHVTGYSTDIFADAACDFIRRTADQPFFLYLPFNAPHYVSRVNTVPDETEKPEWHVPGRYLERYGWPADDSTEKHRYLALLTALDDAVGRVLDTLSETGQDNNTLVMFISDMGAILRPTHGLGVASNAPFRSGAPFMYEGGVRVPAMFRWPGQLAPGTTCTEMLSHMDVLPLCLNAAGIDPPAPAVSQGSDASDEQPSVPHILDGRNPLPALTGAARSPHRFLVFAYGRDVAVRQGHLKAVRPGARGPWELYDLEADPAEQHDLAAKRPQDLAKLQATFQQWSEDTKQDASVAVRDIPARK
ncbi:MAG: sulfatase-like hydrolase/transferase [Fuerstiella sp.]